MTVRQVEDDAEFAAALALSTSTDTVELANGATFGTLLLPGTTANGVTIASQSKWGCTAARFKLQAVEGVQFHDTLIQCVDVGDLGPLIEFNDPNMDGFVMMGCKIRHGNPQDSFADFDPANTGSVYGSIIGDGATATWPDNNLFARGDMSDAVQPTNGALNGSIHIEDCDFYDNSYVFQLTHNGGAEIIIRKNRIYRSYGDVFLLAFPGAFTPLPLVELTGNLLWDCGWAQPQDSENPHGDAFQINSSDVGGPGDSTTPIENLIIAGNAVLCSEGYRGQIQRVFLSDVPEGFPHLGPIVADNVMISRISSLGAILSNGTGKGAGFGYVFRNTFLARPSQNLPKQNELYTNPDTGIPPGTASASRIHVTADTDYPGHSFVGLNVSESITASSSLDSTTQPNITTGLANDGSDYGTWYDVPADWAALDTPEEVFGAFIPKVAYADYGGARQGQTLAQFLDKWSGVTKPYEELPSYVGFLDLRNQAFDAVVTSNWSFVHAGRGSRAMSVGPGLEYRTATDVFGTGASEWSTDDINIGHGTFLQLRTTAASASAITLIRTLQIGNETFQWRVTTVDTTVYPRVTFAGTQIRRQTSGQGYGAAESKLLTVATEFRMVSNPGATMNILGVSSGSNRIEIGVLATGKARARALNNATSQVFRFDSTTTVTGGAWHRLIFTVDTAFATSAAGVFLSVDAGANEATAHGTWVQDGLIDLDFSTSSMQIGGNGSTPALVCDFSFIWVGAGVWLDLSDPEIIERFSASNIGPSGEGPTGTAPRVFLTGTAATWNSGDPNQGSGTAYGKVTGVGDVDLAAFNADVWPPVLNLASAAQGVSPFPVNEELDILVQASGYPKSVNVTAASDKAGTWAANPVNMPVGSNGITFSFTPTVEGDHTITFTNDGGYNNPAPLVITVGADTPVVVPYNGIKRAIKQGIKRSIKHNMRDWS